MRFFPLLAAALIATPLAFAQMEMRSSKFTWESFDWDLWDPSLGAPTGEYYQPVTQLVYWYDSLTRVMVPAGSSADAKGYVEIDAYAPGTRPNLTTGKYNACAAPGYCVAYFAVLANPDQVNTQFHVLVSDACDPPETNPRTIYYHSFSAQVYPYEPAVYESPCQTGSLRAWVNVSGSEVASDTLTR